MIDNTIPTQPNELQDGQRAEILRSFEAATTTGQIVTFKTGELTTRCPFSFGGPDFYELHIVYISDGKTVESRSLKEYLESWRDEETTAELLGEVIYQDIKAKTNPKSLYVRLEQARRGGIEETVEVGDRELRQ